MSFLFKKNRSVDLLDPEPAFRAISKLHMNRDYAEGERLTRNFLAHHNSLPIAAVGLWIGINGARCAMQVAPRAHETRELVEFVLGEILPMREIELDETWNDFWVAPKWDERADAAVSEFQSFLEIGS